MKKPILFTGLFILLFYPMNTFAAGANDSKSLVHTTQKDIEFKKSKALAWNDIYKESELLKKKVFKWYEDHFVKNKSYFLGKDQVKESELKKTKALKWYERNSL